MAKKHKAKGKSPKGRAGQKKKAQKEASYATASLLRAAGHPRYMMGVDDDDDEDEVFMQFKGFAQALPRGDAPPTQPFKLRHQAIKFVSAGTNTPIDTPPQHSDDPAMGAGQDSGYELVVDTEIEPIVDDGLRTVIFTMQAEVPTAEHGVANMNLDGPADDDVGMREAVPEISSAGQGSSLFVFDTVGDATLADTSHSVRKPPPRRAPSPALSTSSTEVIVFHGRNKPIVVDDPITTKPSSSASNRLSRPMGSQSSSSARSGPQSSPIPPPAAPTRVETSSQQANTDLLTALEASLATDPPSSANFTERSTQPSRQKPSGWASQTSKHDQAVNLDATWAPAPAGSWWKKKATRPADAEETIAQLQADWKEALREKKDLKPGSKSNRRRKRGRRHDNRALGDTGDTFEEDSPEMSDAAYQDYIANIVDQEQTPIIGSDVETAFLDLYGPPRVDLGGPSVVIDGRELGEDEVLNKDIEDDDEDEDVSEDDGEDGIVDQSFSDLSSKDMFNSDLDLSGFDSSELDETLEYTEQQQWEDEADLRQRRIDAMDDEKTARLFAKQQELGIDANELILEDGTYDESEGVGDVDAARVGLAGMAGFDMDRGQHRSRPHGSARGNRSANFVNASLMAHVVEQYGEDGFDIMDFDRPSLRATKKGRKGKLPPELEAISDEELRDNVAQTWANDRTKKAQRKAEREELRTQGLLSSSASKTGKPDLREKYPNGISMAQVHEELRIFLLDDSLTRAFPPMNKNDRAVLHQLCNILKLKSKSVGSGNSRFPVLTKTSRTHNNPVLLANAIAASSRGFLGSRKALKKSLAGNVARAGAGGGFSKAAVTLHNGEVVGAGAAEIGKENFGHRMMEKMGWSKGQALGKDGEGRLIPVEQVMRSGRAGLG